MERKEIEEQLTCACKELLLIPLEDFEAHDEACRKSVSNFLAFAPILAPADYFTRIGSGELEFTHQQDEIGAKLLEVRRLIEALPIGVKMRILGAKTMQELIDEK